MPVTRALLTGLSDGCAAHSLRAASSLAKATNDRDVAAGSAMPRLLNGTYKSL